jgi:hypothetical protein
LNDLNEKSAENLVMSSTFMNLKRVDEISRMQVEEEKVYEATESL